MTHGKKNKEKSTHQNTNAFISSLFLAFNLNSVQITNNYLVNIKFESIRGSEHIFYSRYVLVIYYINTTFTLLFISSYSHILLFLNQKKGKIQLEIEREIYFAIRKISLIILK